MRDPAFAAVRRQFRAKNAATLAALGAFVTAVYVYSIAAVRQDDLLDDRADGEQTLKK